MAIVLKFSILNAKVLAMMLPLLSIVSAFATRLLPIVCNHSMAVSKYPKILNCECKKSACYLLPVASR